MIASSIPFSRTLARSVHLFAIVAMVVLTSGCHLVPDAQGITAAATGSRLPTESTARQNAGSNPLPQDTRSTQRQRNASHVGNVQHTNRPPTTNGQSASVRPARNSNPPRQPNQPPQQHLQQAVQTSQPQVQPQVQNPAQWDSQHTSGVVAASFQEPVETPQPSALPTPHDPAAGQPGYPNAGRMPPGSANQLRSEVYPAYPQQNVPSQQLPPNPYGGSLSGPHPWQQPVPAGTPPYPNQNQGAGAAPFGPTERPVVTLNPHQLNPPPMMASEIALALKEELAAANDRIRKLEQDLEYQQLQYRDLNTRLRDTQDRLKSELERNANLDGENSRLAAALKTKEVEMFDLRHQTDVTLSEIENNLNKVLLDTISNVQPVPGQPANAENDNQ